MSQDAGFYDDLLRFGSLRCFKHFVPALRGREELLLTLPCDLPRLTALLSTDRRSAMRDSLVPGSPAARECDVVAALAGEHRDGTTCSFLLAAYGRYSSWPYVWLRTAPPEVPAAERDLPLRLASTQHWRQHGAPKRWPAWQVLSDILSVSFAYTSRTALRVPDVVLELITSVTHLPPDAAFAIDHTAVAKLPPGERVFMSGALINFLREHTLLVRANATGREGTVHTDLARLTAAHVAALSAVTDTA